MQEYFDVLDENGNFTGKVETREKCHKEGLWHRAVVVFILNTKGDVLLQRRNPNKKMWPDMWDVTAGGHVLAGEFGFEAINREAKEEIGIDLDKSEKDFLGSSISINLKGDIVNKHFNEYYVLIEDIDEKNLKLQEDEVVEMKWMSKEEIIRRVESNYDGITDKKGCWEYLCQYYKWLDSKMKK